MADFISDKDFEVLPDEEEKLEESVVSDEEFETLEEVPPETSTLEAVAGGIAEGGTWGFSDEIMGGIKAIPAKLGLIESKRSVFDDDSLTAEYQAQRDDYRSYQGKLREEHPAAYKTAEVGTALATGVATGVGVGAGTLKTLGVAGFEGGAWGLGASEADLAEGEFKEALEDTGIGVGIGVGTAGLGMGAVKGGGKAYKKLFGRGGKDLAEDAAGDVLELTPKMRKEASMDIVKMGPGKRSTVAEELPEYLRERGGFIQSAKKIKANTQVALKESGEEIDNVLTTYDKKINEFRSKLSSKEPFVRGKSDSKALTGKMDDLLTTMEAEIFKKQKSFKFSELADELEESVAKLRDTPGFEAHLSKLDKHIAKLRSKGDITSIKELHTQRKNTDKLIKSFLGLGKSSSADSLLQDALIATRRKMSNHIQDEMLGGAKELAESLYKAGKISKTELQELVTLQDRIYKANRNYKLGSFVNDQIDQAIGRKDARRLISLTDWIIMAQGLHSPVLTGVGLAAKKSGELLRPRAQLYSREIGKGLGSAGKSVKRPLVQQINSLVQGTKYQNVFKEDATPQQNAVKHSVLMSQDPEYRDLYLNKPKEEEE